MAKMSKEEKDILIHSDPDFGKLICRCEKVSLGEIKDVINRECGATTIKGVKMRCRPGMGRCQGGFCEPEVVKIIQKQLDIKLEEVKLDKNNSQIFTAYAKEDL